jgi:hypothetical protein
MILECLLLLEGKNILKKNTMIGAVSVKALAEHVQIPGFNPQYQKKKRNPTMMRIHPRDTEPTKRAWNNLNNKININEFKPQL